MNSQLLAYNEALRANVRLLVKQCNNQRLIIISGYPVRNRKCHNEQISWLLILTFIGWLAIMTHMKQNLVYLERLLSE